MITMNVNLFYLLKESVICGGPYGSAEEAKAAKYNWALLSELPLITVVKTLTTVEVV